MLKRIIFLTTALISLTFGFCEAQYVAHYISKDVLKKDTLTDNSTGVTFIVDKSRTYISAIDRKGKLLWKTDPAKDAKLEKYRVERPTIVYFEIGYTTPRSIIIHIAYNNSQFGYLDVKTGHFYFQGQD